MMTSGGISLINMSYWECGKRRIRYLYLVNNNSFKVVKQGSNEDQMVPLFLGADLFSNTDIRSENQPRYHAKFAKRGLATKLVFSSDCRFQGLRLPFSSNSLWFYSIHGVFKVAFELYSKQDQLSVMESFQDLWKSRIDDDKLNMKYHLDTQVDVQEAQTVTCASSQSHLNFEGENALNNFQTFTDPSTNSSSTDHDYCSSEQSNTIQTALLAQKLNSIGDKVKFITNIEEEQLNATMKILDYVESCITKKPDEGRLTDLVMTLLQTHFQKTFIYSSTLLKTISGWLGQQFSAANGAISRRVEDFKAQHIEHITDLPPPEELASELFPEAMRNLLAHWMGLSEEADEWKRHSEYPILLLILEFANHNLITGVAHVLYSSLISK